MNRRHQRCRKWPSGACRPDRGRAGVQPPGRQAIFHRENGIPGFDGTPVPGVEDWDLIRAGKKAVTLKPGRAIFHHADRFAQAHGGHPDVAILGVYEVAATRNLAYWSTGPKGVPAVGGAIILCRAQSAWPS